MNGYIALFLGKRIEVWADTSYEAQKKAIDEFRPAKSKRHLVTVHLAQQGGQDVVHVAVD